VNIGKLMGSRAFKLAGLLVVVAVVFFVIGYLLVYRFIT
jgi:hypothetical protein